MLIFSLVKSYILSPWLSDQSRDLPKLASCEDEILTGCSLSGLGFAPVSTPLFPIWEYFIIKSRLYSVFFPEQLRKYVVEKLRSQITYTLLTRKLLVINVKRTQKLY